MQLNYIFFQAPKPQYTSESFGTNLIFIKSKDRQVPCFMMKGNSKIWIIYFHGNSQDLLGASQFMQQLKNATEKDFNILAIEYPEYGLYKNAEITEENIQQDAIAAFEYIEKTQENAEIYIMGRSMGTGPACYLASLNKGKGLILISAFASFSKIAYQHAGIFGAIVKNRFQNAIYAKDITIPTLLVHGKADDIISYTQTIEIYENLRSILKLIVLPPDMTHTKYDMIKDISEPLEDFFNLVINN
ncbi:unnamed protein product [Paramecium primaurelia]|uniref:Serine aminopeptidase S33 domain-containing protein n=1 Tax=Paramecium primaurelia TaxID=5886 RepID=A0A8S1JRQ1_PARPR|nr:unnamed protein product [Paramecium primaurelia]